MLITNFSSGELSEELFGRTDLGQYYQGAARIENFDIIPTGGIRKRSGSKRLCTFEFPEGGRIIPFIIERESSCLVGLFPERGEEKPAFMEIYGLSKDENGIETVRKILIEETIPFARTMKEIDEVQYAQKHDVMILVHNNYPPVRVIYNEGKYNIDEMPFEVLVKYEGDKNVTDSLGSVHDETYSNEWLKNGDNYPCAVTFFQDRLVFAGTKQDKQRVFISEVGSIYSFATYKILAAETRKYIAVTGTIESPGGENSECTIKLDAKEYLQFTEPIHEYIIESPFFYDNTKIASLDGILLKLTKGVKINTVTKEEEDDLNALVSNYKEYNSDENQPIQIDYVLTKYEAGTRWERIIQGQFYVSIRPDYFMFIVNVIVSADGDYTNTTESMMVRYDDDIAKKTIAYPDKTQYPDDVQYGKRRTLDDPAYWDKLYEQNFYKFKGEYDYLFKRGLLNTNVDKKRGEIREKALDMIKNSMQFYLPSANYWFYKKAPDIKLTIETYKKNMNQIVIPFYTKKIEQTKMTTPDCGFTFEIASDMSDAIKWMTLNKHLIIGTETAEWIVPAGVTASNIEAFLNSRYGSDKIPAFAIGDAIVFIQSGRKALVEYYLPQQDNNFRANNMTLFSKNMLYESPARGFDFVSSPYVKIFICRELNDIVTLLYERSTGTFAWGRITMKNGEITHAAVLPGTDGFDDVYLMVRRGGRVYLEVLRTEDTVYLDSHKKTGPLTWADDVSEYDSEKAVIVRMAKNESGAEIYETLPVTTEPDWSKGGDFYIGYPYTSIIRTLPVLANNKMAKQRITSLAFRFLKSFLPKVSSIAGGKKIKTDTITNLKTPFSGVHKIAFPGTWDEDVQVELIHEGPEPVKILSLNAEVQ